MTLAAAAVLATALVSGCWERSGDCALHRTCTPCTMDSCAWCYETGECMATGTLCQGERALLPEQCEDDEHRVTDVDASYTGSDAELAGLPDTLQVIER